MKIIFSQNNETNQTYTDSKEIKVNIDNLNNSLLNNFNDNLKTENKELNDINKKGALSSFFIS